MRRTTRKWLLPAMLLLATTGAAIAEETTEQQLVISVERIWDRAAHSAFTDLVQFRDALYCTFREGSGHIPGLNGTIRVIRSRDGMNWESVALLEELHVDLRDPKLSITPDGRLMINMGASYYHGSERQRIESRVSYSNPEGEEFSRPKKIIFPESMITGFDWLWRVTWHDGVAWGCVQQVPEEAERALHLVRSQDGVRYERVAALPVDSPSETTLRFLSDDTMIAMTRRTGPSPEGWIGLAKPPYTEWQFRPTNKAFGGPNLIRLPNGEWLAGSRGYDQRPSTTALWRLDLDTGRFEDVLTFPSGGDTSYPGFVVDEETNRLLVSYYSGHEGKSAIYLATLRLDRLQMVADAPYAPAPLCCGMHCTAAQARCAWNSPARGPHCLFSERSGSRSRPRRRSRREQCPEL